jgi:hypothetical protein
MFAKHPPLPDDAEAAPQGDAKQLRRLEWSELAARLDAARDLRRVLASEAARRQTGTTSFAGAASRFFGSSQHREPKFNPGDLERSKGPTYMVDALTDRGAQMQGAVGDAPAKSGRPMDARSDR